MTIGIVQYILGRKHLQPAIERLESQRRAAKTLARERKVAQDAAGSATPADIRTFGGFTVVEWKRLAAMGVFFVLAAVFWGAYEQAGSSLNLFGDRYTRTTMFGVSFPSSWFLTVQAIWVIVLAPAFAWLWIRLGKYEPSTPAKFAIGLFFTGLSFLFLLIPAVHLQESPECA